MHFAAVPPQPPPPCHPTSQLPSAPLPAPHPTLPTRCYPVTPSSFPPALCSSPSHCQPHSLPPHPPGTTRFVPEACSNVAAFLPAHVVGQDLAINQLVDAVCEHLAPDADGSSSSSHGGSSIGSSSSSRAQAPRKPLIISVHGPPGVGKTFTHTLLARALYNKDPAAAADCPGEQCKGAKVGVCVGGGRGGGRGRGRGRKEAGGMLKSAMPQSTGPSAMAGTGGGRRCWRAHSGVVCPCSALSCPPAHWHAQASAPQYQPPALHQLPLSAPLPPPLSFPPPSPPPTRCCTASTTWRPTGRGSWGRCAGVCTWAWACRGGGYQRCRWLAGGMGALVCAARQCRRPARLAQGPQPRNCVGLGMNLPLLASLGSD